MHSTATTLPSMQNKHTTQIDLFLIGRTSVHESSSKIICKHADRWNLLMIITKGARRIRELSSFTFFFFFLNSKWNFHQKSLTWQKSLRRNTLLTMDKVSNLLWHVLCDVRTCFRSAWLANPRFTGKAQYWTITEKDVCMYMWQSVAAFPICLLEEFKMWYLIWTFPTENVLMSRTWAETGFLPYYALLHPGQLLFTEVSVLVHWHIYAVN